MVNLRSSPLIPSIKVGYDLRASRYTKDVEGVRSNLCSVRYTPIKNVDTATLQSI